MEIGNCLLCAPPHHSRPSRRGLPDCQNPTLTNRLTVIRETLWPRLQYTLAMHECTGSVLCHFALLIEPMSRFPFRPTGWENDANEERFKLSTMDYLVACVYVSYAIFFRIDDDATKPKVAGLLKQALEMNLQSDTTPLWYYGKRP